MYVLEIEGVAGKDKKLVELHESVTASTGDRGLSLQIIGDKRLDDGPLELLLQIEHVERKSQLLGHAPSIIDIIQGAASAKLRLAVLLGIATIIPQLHGTAHHVIALILQNHGRSGTVHSTAHCQ